MAQPSFFDWTALPGQLAAQLRETNPWWVGLPGRVLPQYRRAAYEELRRKLTSGLAPAVVLRGPRQVGKTTLQEQLITGLLGKGVPPTHIFRMQFDDLPTIQKLDEPILTLARWFQDHVLKQTFNQAAGAGQPAYLFFDEVQNLDEWAPQIKALVDTHTVRVVVTGSSALRIEAGRDSLAGRVSSIELGPLLLREVMGLQLGAEIPALLEHNGLDSLTRLDFWKELVDLGLAHQSVRDQAFAVFSDRGGYPVAYAQQASVPWPQVADQLNETVIQRVIQHDLRMGQRGRKRDQRLLEEIFRLACRYAGQAPGQAVYVQEIKSALDANIGWQRVLSYLKFLDGSLLIKLIEPLEIRLRRRRSNMKVCLCDHALRASWLQEVIPLDPDRLSDLPHLSDLAGHIAESVAGYFLSSIPHLDVSHFPARRDEPEVDFVMTVGEKRVPVEVKYRRRIDPHRDTLGLRAFLERTVYNAPVGLLVTLDDGVEVPDPRIVAVPLKTLLLMR